VQGCHELFVGCAAAEALAPARKTAEERTPGRAAAQSLHSEAVLKSFGQGEVAVDRMRNGMGTRKGN
jgi:hypothetical protein